MRRPPKPMPSTDWAKLRGTDWLVLHHMILLGIADMVANPSPKPEEEALWVRQHAFAAHHPAMERAYPNGFL